MDLSGVRNLRLSARMPELQLAERLRIMGRQEGDGSTRLIDKVDCLVGQETVGNISV